MVSLLQPQPCSKHLPCMSRLDVSNDLPFLQHPFPPLQCSMTLPPAKRCSNPFSLENSPGEPHPRFPAPAQCPIPTANYFTRALSETPIQVQLPDVCPDSEGLQQQRCSTSVYSIRGRMGGTLQYSTYSINVLTNTEETLGPKPPPHRPLTAPLKIAGIVSSRPSTCSQPQASSHSAPLHD